MNGSSYLAGDIANDRRAAHPKNAPIPIRLGVFFLLEESVSGSSRGANIVLVSH